MLSAVVVSCFIAVTRRDEMSLVMRFIGVTLPVMVR
jgi:hypothetical protein